MSPLTALPIALLSLISAAHLQPVPDKPANPPRPATSPATPAVKAEPRFKTAEELLTALETADREIRTISTELNFTTVAGEIEGGDRQIRQGRLYFRNRTEAKAAAGAPAPKTGDPKPDAKPEPKPDPKSETGAAASVRFERLILPSNKMVAEKKTYVVNGPVVVERIEDEKLVNIYRIAKGAQEQDPLKLGQGPFPLPFGQKKEEVLARFTASLVDTGETLPETMKARFAETCQLKLTPKPNAGISAKVKEIRVWYGTKDLLPVLARIMRPDGGFDEFYLIGTQVNAPLPEGIFDTSIPAGWKVQEKER